MKMKPGLLLLPSLLCLLSLLVARPPPAQLCCQQLPLFAETYPFLSRLSEPGRAGRAGGPILSCRTCLWGVGKAAAVLRDICVFSIEQKEKHFFQQQRLAGAP